MRSLYISPSQVETYLGCPRKWWFDYVRRMPRDAGQDQFVFGNTLHAVLERWFKADDNGRDPNTGKPVDLYPDGWDAHVSPAESVMIRKLVKTGIDSGMLTRYPGRVVEDGYKREVLPGVVMSGKMDVEHRHGVDDHKSSSNRRYFLTEKALADDSKMLCYAHEWIVRREENDEDLPDVVTLKLNYFCKNPDDPITKPVAVDVEIDVVRDWWDSILLPAAEEMKGLAELELPDSKWREVEGPRVEGICKKYRGCPHAPVCCRVRAVKAHRRILERTARPEISDTQPKPKPQSKPRGATKMSLFNKAKKRNGGMPAPGSEKEPEDPKPVVQEKQAEVTGGTPPWANPNCVACAGSGISRSNTPCDPCINISKRRKTYDPDEWIVSTDDEGNVSWEPADGSGEAGSATSIKEPEAKPEKPARKRVTREEKAEEPKKPTRVRKPRVEEPPPVVEDEPEEPAEKDDEVQVDAPDSVPGLVILVGATVVRWEGRDVVMLSDVLAAEGERLAGMSTEADSYYALHPFNRRDALAAEAREIAESLAGKVVLALGDCPDLARLRDVLIPHAEVVIGRAY